MSPQARTFESACATRGRIDTLCANAGIGDPSSMYLLRHRGKDEITPEPDLTCTDAN